MRSATVYHGDVVKTLLAALEAESFDACLCDPPYGLEFMGAEWDRLGRDARAMQSWHAGWAAALERVLKPGAHVLAFGGTRTHHRLMCALEDAGFEIRDCLMWLYGSGFPKSLDISKAIDKAAGAEREVVGSKAGRPGYSLAEGRSGTKTIFGEGLGGKGDPVAECSVTTPATFEAERFAGYGTALKPAWEPVILAMKPCAGTFAQNAERYEVAGLNIKGGRIEGDEDGSRNRPPSRIGSDRIYAQDEWTKSAVVQRQDTTGLGRWPANLLLDEQAAERLDREAGWTQSGSLTPENQLHGGYAGRNPNCYGTAKRGGLGTYAENEGGPSRFFYTAKVSSAERGDSNHPAMKPIDLAAYLATLLLPPARDDGEPRRLLVPFAGSGSEVIGALRAGWEEVVAIERDLEWVKLAANRIRDDAPLLNRVEVVEL